MNIKQPQYIRSALALAVCIGIVTGFGPIGGKSKRCSALCRTQGGAATSRRQGRPGSRKKAFRAHSGRHHGAHQDPGGFDPP